MIVDLKPYPLMKNSRVPWLGEVPEHWGVRRLKETFSKIIGGSTPSSAKPSYWDGDIVWVTPADVSKTARLRASQRRITTEGLAACSTELVPSGSVVVTSRAPVGNVAIAEVELCTNQGCKALVIAPRALEPIFAFHVLTTLKGELQSLATGTTFTEISTTRIGDVRMPIPPLPEQAAIVRFLDHADRRIRRYIRAKQKLIKLLEEEKQAIIHRAVTRGLDPNVRLKPSGVEWLGDVPENWEVRRLRSLAHVNTGNRDTVDRVDSGQYPFFVRSQTVERIDTWAFDGEAVLTAGDGAGVAKVFHYVNGRFDYHQRVYKFSEFRDVLGMFFFAYFRATLKFEALAGNAKSTVDSLRRPMLQNFPVVVPPKEEQTAIVSFLGRESTRIEDTVSHVREEIALLREYRARLIADVVTGKLDVREAAARLPDEAAEAQPFDDDEALADPDPDAQAGSDDVSDETAAALDE